MSNSIDTGSPLGEDFYSFQKDDKETSKKNNSKLKVANKKNSKNKNTDNETNNSVDYFINTGTEPDK